LLWLPVIVLSSAPSPHNEERDLANIFAEELAGGVDVLRHLVAVLFQSRASSAECTRDRAGKHLLLLPCLGGDWAEMRQASGAGKMWSLVILREQRAAVPG